MSEYKRVEANHLISRAAPERATISQPRRPLAGMQLAWSNQAAQQFAQYCPLSLPSPSRCPFGGICHSCPVRPQAKLTVSQSGDQYEEEADRVADQVMRMPESAVQRAGTDCDDEPIQAKPLSGQITPFVQRQVPLEEEEEEEEEEIQTKSRSIQRQVAPEELEEEEEVQAKSNGSRTAGRGVTGQIQALPGGHPLDTTSRRFFEPRFGRDFSQVRVHHDQAAARLANELDARAFTVGSNIVFGRGEFAPSTRKGQRLMAHELVHVVQQRAAAPASAIQKNSADREEPGRVDRPGSTLANPPVAGTPTPAPTPLSWTHQKRHRWDALWFFCGEHPAGFSTTARLRANGIRDPNRVEWFVRQGADKVYAPAGWRGSEIVLHSSAGSRRRDDVIIEVQEGTRSHQGRLTVRKPHRLRQEWTNDHANCPPWATCPAACSAWWTEFQYRVIDNVGGTIVGATVNERFPGAKTNDRANNWPSPAAFITRPFWPNTNGTFVDNWFIACGNPSPVAIGAANSGDRVDHMQHEFWVGSRTPGRGCRVQVHTAQRYRGYTDHLNIRTPAP